MVAKTTYKCVAREMSGGSSHEHIAYLWWIKIVDGKTVGEPARSSREQMVAFIENYDQDRVWCPDVNPGRTGAWVHVHSNGRIKYVQTVADGRKSDNLLSLPLR
ncbi:MULTISPECIES: DUF3892 domain-containing protein [Caballeronia]|uniref:DUF3892 domain-containing protein n=1 Tax=Caballeronia TaxID=1827195 RepID=UPI00029C39D6|nr:MULTISPECIES: DUF3892 domain-containing protein [Caballeronia]EKS71836.1 hypothetical protein BURK_008366 [Burkholderia sp. SJ98]